MSVATVKAGLVSVLTTALASDTAVQVFSGPPGSTVVPDVVSVMSARAEIDGEEERFILDLIVSCYVGGGTDAQATSSARAHTLLTSIRAAIVAAPTLSSTCRVAALDFDYQSNEAIGYDAAGRVPAGRLTEIQATVSAWSDRPLIGSIGSAHNVP